MVKTPPPRLMRCSIYPKKQSSTCTHCPHVPRVASLSGRYALPLCASRRLLALDHGRWAHGLSVNTAVSKWPSATGGVTESEDGGVSSNPCLRGAFNQASGPGGVGGYIGSGL